MSVDRSVLVLRLAGPLQSWGDRSVFNRRETRPEPTKSGVIGLLAAAAGHQRTQPLGGLRDLELGVRVDQPGSLLRDYHTVSDYRGRPLLSASTTARGAQKATSPAKFTHVTHRFYLQDAVFVAAVGGPSPLIDTLAEAVRSPAFPLALGRRSCVPTQPLVLRVRTETVPEALRSEPWHASRPAKARFARRFGQPKTIDLPVTIDDDNGPEVLHDAPESFDPLDRRFTARRITHSWVRVPTGFESDDHESAHDPFALLGW